MAIFNQEFKDKVDTKLDEASRFITKHRWFISGSLVFLTAVFTFAGKAIARSSGREDNYYKDTHVYDPSLGHYWELRRKLSNNQWLEVESRIKNGEKYGEVLSSMGVLK